MTAKLKVSPKNRILRAAVKRFEEAVAMVCYNRPVTTVEDENLMFVMEEYRLAKANLNSHIGLTRKTK